MAELQFAGRLPAAIVLRSDGLLPNEYGNDSAANIQIQRAKIKLFWPALVQKLGSLQNKSKLVNVHDTNVSVYT